MNKISVKKNQLWRDKNTGRVVQIVAPAPRNNWTIVHFKEKLNGSSSRHLKEGTLKRFYALVGENGHLFPHL